MLAATKGVKMAAEGGLVRAGTEAVRLLVDNSVVVSMIRRNHGGGAASREALEEWLQLMRSCGLVVHGGWISTKKNVWADMLSRGWSEEEVWRRWRAGEGAPRVEDDMWLEEGEWVRVLRGLGVEEREVVEMFAGTNPARTSTRKWGRQLDHSGLHPNGLDLMDGRHEWWRDGRVVMWCFPPLGVLHQVLERLWSLLRQPGRVAPLVLVTPEPQVARWRLGSLPGRAKEWMKVRLGGLQRRCSEGGGRRADGDQQGRFGLVAWRL